jgi:hypothetical protein
VPYNRKLADPEPVILGTLQLAEHRKGYPELTRGLQIVACTKGEGGFAKDCMMTDPRATLRKVISGSGLNLGFHTTWDFHQLSDSTPFLFLTNMCSVNTIFRDVELGLSIYTLVI